MIKWLKRKITYLSLEKLRKQKAMEKRGVKLLFSHDKTIKELNEVIYILKEHGFDDAYIEVGK